MDTNSKQIERGIKSIQKAKQLVPIILNAVGDTERNGTIPTHLLEKLFNADFFRLVLPIEYGGVELNPSDFAMILEEISRHDASVAWCLAQNNNTALIAAHMLPNTAKKIFDGPNAVVAWGPGIGEAFSVEGGYLLTGRFDFVSGNRHATWLGAHVHILDGRKERCTEEGTPAIFTLLFPRSLVAVQENWDALGLKGTGSDSFSAKEVFVPDQFCVARLRGAKPVVSGRLYVFSQSNLYATGFASIALGVGRSFMETFVDIIANTVPRGSTQERSANNVVQSTIGQTEARLSSAKTFLYATLDDLWRTAQTNDEFTEAEEMRLRLASTWAIQQARESVNQLYLSAGALAVLAEKPFEKKFRDINTLSQQIQGHVAHFETVGQIILGLNPTRPLFTF